MKKVIQPLAWGLVLASVLALASGLALSAVSGIAMTAQSTALSAK